MFSNTSLPPVPPAVFSAAPPLCWGSTSPVSAYACSLAVVPCRGCMFCRLGKSVPGGGAGNRSPAEPPDRSSGMVPHAIAWACRVKKVTFPSSGCASGNVSPARTRGLKQSSTYTVVIYVVLALFPPGHGKELVGARARTPRPRELLAPDVLLARLVSTRVERTSSSFFWF